MSSSTPMGHFDASYHLSFGYIEGSQALVNANIKKEDGSEHKCILSVNYDEKSLREHYHIPQDQPIQKIIQKIIHEIKPETMLDFMNRQVDNISTSYCTFKVIQSEETQAVSQAILQEKKESLLDSPVLLIRQPQLNYLENLQKNALKLEESFTSPSLEVRQKGSEKFVKLRKKLASNVFNNVVHPQIEALMQKHGDTRPIDEVLCIYGFNRLFTRNIASAGTDIDFMLVLDTENQELINDIREVIQKHIRPELNKVGIDMETANFLIIGLPAYERKLDDIRSALFTLANMFNPLKEKENVTRLTGSEAMLHDRIFKFNDKQLSKHLTKLLFKSGNLLHEDKKTFQATVSRRLQEEGDSFRNPLIDHLQRAANSELYIGKEPYNGKQTIQTIMAKADLPAKREERTAIFSTKFCINRMVDLVRSTTITPEMSNDQINALESLGLFLCNAVSYLEAKEAAPVTVLEAYSDITLDQIRQMSSQDRAIGSSLLSSLGIVVDDKGFDFPEQFYDALWQLADRINAQAQWLEQKIYADAKSFVMSAAT